jgi:hypothetical protein
VPFHAVGIGDRVKLNRHEHTCDVMRLPGATMGGHARPFVGQAVPDIFSVLS